MWGKEDALRALKRGARQCVTLAELAAQNATLRGLQDVDLRIAMVYLLRSDGEPAKAADISRAFGCAEADLFAAGVWAASVTPGIARLMEAASVPGAAPPPAAAPIAEKLAKPAAVRLEECFSENGIRLQL
jgi:hypothetical protein